MRLIALIGTLVLLILPFAFISVTVGDAGSSQTWMGMVYYSSEIEVFGFPSSQTETFQFDWLQDRGLYHFYFDPLFTLGIIVLIGLVANIPISLVSGEKNNKNLPAFILIGLGVALFIIRLVALSEDNLSFYDQQDLFLVTRTYLEIPLGLIYSLVFGILDLRK